MELHLKFNKEDLELIEEYKSSDDENLRDKLVQKMIKLIASCFELLDLEESETNADYDLKIDKDLIGMTLIPKNAETVDLFNRMQYLINKKYNE